MNRLALVLPLLGFLVTAAFADDAAARAAFSTPPGRSVATALKRAVVENKRVLVFVTDPKKGHAFHLKATVSSEETQKLLKENFIVVLTDFHDKYVSGVIKDVNPEHPAFVLFKPDGTVIEQGTAAMGAARGFDLVKKWVTNPTP
jgi:hypothetical protein